MITSSNLKTILNRIALATLVVGLIMCTGCFRKTAVGFYGPTMDHRGMKTKQQKQFIIISDFDLTDTRHAINRALGLQGAVPEVSKDKMMSGYVHYEPDPYTFCACTYATYLEPERDGKTKILVLVDDQHNLGNSHHRFATELVQSINTVLASYE